MTNSNGRTTQTTTKKTDVTFTFNSVMITASISKADLTQSVNFVKTGAVKRGLALVTDWTKTGTVVAKIKANVDKGDFKKAIDSVYGTAFNNNNRAYCQRLAEQDLSKLVKWYNTTKETATSPKMVFERYAKANPTDCVNPPAPKTPPVVEPSNPDNEDKTETQSLTVSQSLTTTITLMNKCRVQGNAELANLEAWRSEMAKMVEQLDASIALEVKASKVAIVRAKKVA